ncbi:FAD-dependent monooxygenase [Nocardia sp. alder85J]|uniref:FAD-dependent monooxygenase n=1 Tax=Nocardia sp. alder85J TaxID=2862949 RepID=UPI001CD74888|nr:FAD-dependent monooxygenase [Nocardia sp. alder85J]MCX4096376.1 FAD-dependent monooxygenase [Nocardia sp. alder85J]
MPEQTTSPARTDYDVLIVGAGPVGLMLAIELRTAGIRVLVIERLAEPDTAVKAGAVNAAATAALERRGLLPALREALRRLSVPVDGGRAPSVGHFGGIQVPAGPVDREDPVLRGRGADGWYLPIPQAELERVLGRYAAELGVDIRRGVEVRGFDADESGVTVGLNGSADVRAAWLAGCDGGHSLVRRLAGFEFTGTDPGITGRQAIATVTGADGLPPGWQHTPTGVYVHGPMPGRVRTVEFDGPPADREAPVTATEIEDSLRRVTGADIRVTDLVAGTRFTDNARQATTYRRGRVLLCGDAAHVHSPFSGQGLNLGLGDAVNLGWKLAATVRGRAPAGLLDTYTAERHPIGAWVLDWTRAQVAVMRGDADSRALRAVVTDFLGTRDGATYYVQRVSGLWQHYDLGGGHPLVGATTPELRLGDGTRLADHTRSSRALLVDLAGDDRLTALAEQYSGRLELVRARSGDTTVSSVLIRPDGVVAWAADGIEDLGGLETALTRWLGSGVRVPSEP